MERVKFFPGVVSLDHGQAPGHGQTRQSQASRQTGVTSTIALPNHFDFSRRIFYQEDPMAKKSKKSKKSKKGKKGSKVSPAKAE